jgi:hypothetical protein
MTGFAKVSWNFVILIVTNFLEVWASTPLPLLHVIERLYLVTFLDCLTLKLKALRSFEKSEIIY